MSSDTDELSPQLFIAAKTAESRSFEVLELSCLEISSAWCMLAYTS